LTIKTSAGRIVLGMNPVIYCADIGSVPNGRFGWAWTDSNETIVESHRGGMEIADLVNAVVQDLAAGRSIALGFECPLFVPVPEEPLHLGRARLGDGNCLASPPEDRAASTGGLRARRKAPVRPMRGA
jgi:hypothetical protein